MNNNGSRTIAFLIGAVAGGVTAALLTPRSGPETRQQLKEGARDIYGKAEEKAVNIKDVTKDKVENIADTARTQSHAVKQAASVAKDAYRDELRKQREA